MAIKITGFILPEPPADDTDKWFWDNYLEVKAKGVYAAQQIQKGTAIPYYGVEYKQHKEKSPYVIEVNKKLFIDGNPKLDTRNLFIAARINEPKKGEEHNMILVKSVRQNEITESRVHLVTVRDIAEGEELTRLSSAPA